MTSFKGSVSVRVSLGRIKGKIKVRGRVLRICTDPGALGLGLRLVSWLGLGIKGKIKVRLRVTRICTDPEGLGLGLRLGLGLSLGIGSGLGSLGYAQTLEGFVTSSLGAQAEMVLGVGPRARPRQPDGLGLRLG